MNTDDENARFLKQDFNNFCKLNEYQHQTILNKLDVINLSLEKELISHNKRMEKLEKGHDSFKEWKIYTIALITFIGIIIPYVLSKLFS